MKFTINIDDNKGNYKEFETNCFVFASFSDDNFVEVMHSQQNDIGVIELLNNLIKIISESGN